MNQDDTIKSLKIMSIKAPFEIKNGEKLVASISKGEYVIVEREQYDDLVTDYLKAKGAAE